MRTCSTFIIVLVLLLFTAQFGTNYIFLINILRLFLSLQRIPGFSLPAVGMGGLPPSCQKFAHPPPHTPGKIPPRRPPPHIRFLLPPTSKVNYPH